MVKLIKIREVIVVEGRYDKIKLSSMIEGTILETNGFGIFNDKELLQNLRTMAEKVGLIILTDSDDAGFKIRRYLHGSIQKGKLIDVYIPELYGKEKRKLKPSAAGLLGVEGVSIAVLTEAFRNAGVMVENGEADTEPARPITKLDLFQMGLSGGADSKTKREELLRSYNLPGRISPNTIVNTLNAITTYEELKERVEKLFA